MQHMHSSSGRWRHMGAHEDLSRSAWNVCKVENLYVQTLWAVDRDCEDDPITGSRRPAHCQYPSTPS